MIFDCDGVLIDSEPIANRVFMEQLAMAGLRMRLDEVMRTFIGKTRDACIALAGEIRGEPLPADFAASWDHALYEALEREVKPVRHVPQLLDGMTLPWCVASNGERERTELALKAAGLFSRVEGKLFTASMVARPKPAPDLFLHAARTMGFSPRDTAVVEDSPTGARAGVAAGMRVFAYAGASHADEAALREAGACIFHDMAELPGLWARA